MGAHTGTITNFLQNAITLIHLTTTDTNTEILPTIHESFATSRPPRRVIIILPFEEALSQVHQHSFTSTHYRTHILMTILPDTLQLARSPSLYTPETTCTTHPKLALLLLDHTSAPTFHAPAIQADIVTTFSEHSDRITVHPPPWFHKISTQHAHTSHERTPPSAHPGLNFLTTQPTYIKLQKKKGQASLQYTNFPETDLLISLLGYPPQQLVYNTLRAAKHTPQATTSDKHTFITTCLLATTQKAHARLRYWRLQQNYGSQTISSKSDADPEC
jgi:hypothetical protein